ncbi:MAG: sel1 repeat family protein [Hydrogenophaga sp.]|uniref:tetratricopeptide repeat protein n=1 Tax=Hydrogenophaga sp. TaxID=1904254 RepID=UPI0025BD35C8|nr:tetratricopeptide repeat protein [Hydrogenophaga sp.]MBU7572505.1 sel1 repeat family protein [Hydrogenophaga sp.]
MSTTSPTPSHRTRWWALGLLLAVCAVAFTYPQLRELHHMNQLPRNMKLTAFDPHRPGFECVHEATKVPPIDPEAQEWLEQGLALSSYDQWYEDRDWAGAAALWHKAAERRHWKAMMNLVSLYANGRGEGKLRVERDLERAVLITEEAMQLGIPAAFDFMGTLHWEGRGVNGDASRAYAFWQLAADMGSPSAMAYLGKALQASYNNPSQGFWENRKVALKMLECGLAQGHGQAAYELGVAIDGDDKELDEDYGRALLALHSAVKFGSAEAAVYMAASFWGGEPLVGRAKDPVRGERYSAFGEALRRNPERCPQSGIWQPFARDKAHPLAHLLSTANLNETWKRQAFVPQGEPLPSLSAQGLPLDDEQVGWWLLHASEAGCYAPAQKA